MTIDHLRTWPLLVAHLTAERIRDIPLSETPALMAAINSSPHSPSIQTVGAHLITLPHSIVKLFFLIYSDMGTSRSSKEFYKVN